MTSASTAARKRSGRGSVPSVRRRSSTSAACRRFRCPTRSRPPAARRSAAAASAMTRPQLLGRHLAEHVAPAPGPPHGGTLNAATLRTVAQAPVPAGRAAVRDCGPRSLRGPSSIRRPDLGSRREGVGLACARAGRSRSRLRSSCSRPQSPRRPRRRSSIPWRCRGFPSRASRSRRRTTCCSSASTGTSTAGCAGSSWPSNSSGEMLGSLASYLPEADAPAGPARTCLAARRRTADADLVESVHAARRRSARRRVRDDRIRLAGEPGRQDLRARRPERHRARARDRLGHRRRPAARHLARRRRPHLAAALDAALRRSLELRRRDAEHLHPGRAPRRAHRRRLRHLGQAGDPRGPQHAGPVLRGEPRRPARPAGTAVPLRELRRRRRLPVT